MLPVYHLLSGTACPANVVSTSYRLIDSGGVESPWSSGSPFQHLCQKGQPKHTLRMVMIKVTQKPASMRRTA